MSCPRFAIPFPQPPDVFDLADVDKSQDLSSDEALFALKLLTKTSAKVPTERFEAWAKNLDADKNGRISKAEFLAAMDERDRVSQSQILPTVAASEKESDTKDPSGQARPEGEAEDAKKTNQEEKIQSKSSGNVQWPPSSGHSAVATPSPEPASDQTPAEGSEPARLHPAPSTSQVLSNHGSNDGGENWPTSVDEQGKVDADGGGGKNSFRWPTSDSTVMAAAAQGLVDDALGN